MNKNYIPKKEEKKYLFNYWKHELHLDDWLIDLRDGIYPVDMELESVQGECSYKLTKKMAVISIINDACYSPDLMEPFDWEVTLVHEMLHCYFAILDDTDDILQNRIIHQMIEELSKALVKSRRENPNGYHNIKKAAHTTDGSHNK